MSVAVRLNQACRHQWDQFMAEVMPQERVCLFLLLI